MTAGSYVLTYDKLVAPFGSLLNFFFGNIPGAIGETSSLLCIVSFIYLTYKKMIKWRIPVYVSLLFNNSILEILPLVNTIFNFKLFLPA